MQPSGTASIALSQFTSGVVNFGQTTFASVAAPASPSEAFTTRVVNAQPSYCTATNLDGCIHSEVRRRAGTVTLGQLPANVPAPSAAWTAGCKCYVQISNFFDTVSSESGISAGLPTATQNTGTLTYYDPTINAYQNKAINWGGSPPALAIPSLTVSQPFAGGTVTISMNAAGVAARGTSTNNNAGISASACSTAVCTANATSSSPVTGDIIYTVTWTPSGGPTTTLINADISIDLGTLSAQTSYQAAP